MIQENYHALLPVFAYNWFEQGLGKHLRLSYIKMPKRSFSLTLQPNETHFIANACYFEILEDGVELPPERTFLKVSLAEQPRSLGYEFVYNWEMKLVKKNLLVEETMFQNDWVFVGGNRSPLKALNIFGYQFNQVPYPVRVEEDDPEEDEYEGSVSANIEKVIAFLYEDGSMLVISGDSHDLKRGELRVSFYAEATKGLEQIAMIKSGLVFQDIQCLKVITLKKV